MEFPNALLLIWCLFLPAISASHFHRGFCSNNSHVETQKIPEGYIILPLTTFKFPAKRCFVEIRSSVDIKTEITLFNLRRKRQNEECSENYVEILNRYYNQSLSTFCKSVGNMETLILKSTVVMAYRASSRNIIDGNNSSESAIMVHYKRLAACGKVLTAPSGAFQTAGYPTSSTQSECEWVIDTENRGWTLFDFDIKNAHNLDCNENFIEIRENLDSPPVKKICTRSYHRTFRSDASKLWVKIKTTTLHGIVVRATYKTQTCKVVAFSNQLDFNSPMTAFCQTWNLTATSGQIAALSFSYVNLMSLDSSSCSGNVLEIWDGETQNVYCNLKRPPAIIMSKGRKLVVTYRTNSLAGLHFRASFTSIPPSNFKTNCFIQNRELSFKCNNQQVIPCAWQCDGAMQCPDNSDENVCPEMEKRWHKLQLFVIVMGSICASTVVFCVGLVCFRKFIIQDGSSSSEGRRRRFSVNDQSALTLNADLPSPPPGYFTDREEEPPAAVVRGTYFFGDEFSQSGIHSASLFGIPPPRYRSTESLHQVDADAHSIWQRGISSIPLIPTNIMSVPEEEPPRYDSVSPDKGEQIVISTTAPNTDVSPHCEPETSTTSSSEQTLHANNLHNEIPVEVETHVPNTTANCVASTSNERISDDCRLSTDIGMTNAGATLDV